MRRVASGRRAARPVPLIGAATMLVLSCVGGAASFAQSQNAGGVPPPPGMTMPDYAAHRFPQPVRVGQLVGEAVQQPVESQTLLGRVRAVVRAPDGELGVVVHYGGFRGIGGRDILVPLDAMALLGPVMEITGFTPRALDRFPDYRPAGEVVLGPDSVVRVGLAKPSH